MDPNIFSFLQTFHSICFFAFVFFTSLALTLDPKYEACAPKSCGVGPLISYPFWISDLQQSYCGIPNFEISCSNDYPLLKISSDEYYIKNIFSNNHSFLVVSATAYDDSCPTPSHNISLDRTPFNISPGYVNLTFLYDCSTQPSELIYPISCASNDTSFSFATFHASDLESYDNLLKSCKYTTNTPLYIGGADIGSDVLISKNISRLLEIGFYLNWTTQNCSTCDSSGGRCGFENNNFICFCSDGSHGLESCYRDGRNNVRLKVIIGVCAGVFGALLVCLVGHIVYRRRKKNIFAPMSWMPRSITTSYTSSKSKLDVESGEFKGVHLFSYDELEEATNHFAPENELGDGGFGTVYKGKLRDKRVVAVKRLYENNYKRVEQFMNEVGILTGLRHPNLVSLYGCTSRHSRELLLVYEYISNGTVADHLHGNRKMNGGLPWSIRMKIALETATALTFLHTSEIIHRDVKTNNILLDNNFVVKVADFGLSRLFPTDVTHVSTAPQGTPGYVDPEYHECYQLTVKSDVYSFGVVLVELISSLPAVDITRHRHEINLSNMAINKIQSDALHELVDKNLGYESDYKVRKMINAVAELAFQCLQSAKEMRPSMEDVLQNLKQIQKREHNMDKAEDSELQSDDIGLLKNGQIPPSPDTVTTQWSSSSYSTTSNTSG